MIRLKYAQTFSLIMVIVLSIPLVVSVYAKGECEDGDLEKCQEEIEKYQDRYESTSKKLDEIRNQKDAVLVKIDEYSSQINVTDAEVNALQSDINVMEGELAVINQNLQVRKGSLDDKTSFRNSILRRHYRRGILNTLEIFFAATNFTTQGVVYGIRSDDGQDLTGFQYNTLSHMISKFFTIDAMQIMKVLNSEISSYEGDKKDAEDIKNELEFAQNRLLALKASLAGQITSEEGVLGDLSEEEEEHEEELADIQGQLGRLTSLQNEILGIKSGEGIISGYEAAGYTLPDPPFKPAFAGMSYGAFTHYDGMSQYGAKGRAEAGKGYKEILEHYYKTGVDEKNDFPDKICVDGYGDLDFQYYLHGIAEMPGSWPKDALKAQAVAARTYAYNYTKGGGCICTSQSCQVFLQSKADNPPGSWRDAVDETKDKILNNPSTSRYSSTTGGYLNQSGWDTAGGSWPGDAYEKRANSPWFYKAWYTQSYTDNSSKCGRSTPWLKKDELADILNSWVVYKKSEKDRDRISPVTKDCWGGDPYSHDKMKEKADEYGGSYSDISSVSVNISNGGYTASITFGTNRGNVTIDGAEFKTVFNLRAPAYVAIRSRLYDMEMEN
jgi:peptidoglycan hydrolase-like amidase/peptidoglycan hydrolase CwlO-like protein